ncbi:MAG: serine hydrolase domain-containing protein [Acidobacteriota bacterium]
MLLRLLVWWVAIGGLQAQILSLASPEEVGMSSLRLARLDQVIQRAIEEEETPGAVALVARKGKVVYRKAFGYKSLVPRKEPVSVDTIFDVASLTKVLATATSVMLLVEEGRLSLTDRVSVHLPDFARNGKGSVTVLQLLTHYSGLRPDLDLDDLWEGYDDGIERALNEQLVASPGETFIYSDINYLVLAELIRKVGGQPLHEFSAERIFEPLGMEHTYFFPPEELQSRIAPTEFRNGTMLQGAVHDPTTFRMGGYAGHAGLFSTVEDTAIYAQMILNLGEFKGVRILSPLAVLKMTTSQSPEGTEPWRGIGFDIRSPYSGPRGDLFPIGSFGHTGFTGTSLWIDPFSQAFVILFTNRVHPEGGGSVTSLRKKVASVVAGSIMDGSIVPEHYFHRD